MHYYYIRKGYLQKLKEALKAREITQVMIYKEVCLFKIIYKSPHTLERNIVKSRHTTIILYVHEKASKKHLGSMNF